jgi:hypothetical protein
MAHSYYACRPAIATIILRLNQRSDKSINASPTWRLIVFNGDIRAVYNF